MGFKDINLAAISIGQGGVYISQPSRGERTFDLSQAGYLYFAIRTVALFDWKARGRWLGSTRLGESRRLVFGSEPAG